MSRLRVRVVGAFVFVFVCCLATAGPALAGSARPSSFQGLGYIPGDQLSSASAVSDDGSSRDGANGTRAVVWDDQFGMVALSVLLEQLGLDLTGWTLEHAIAISNDGSTIVGYGTNPLGFTEAFVATIPEPGTGLLLGLGLLGLGLRRGR